MAIQWSELEKWLRNQSRQVNWDSLKDSRFVEDFLSNFVPNQEANRQTTHAQRWEIKEGKEVLEVSYPLPADYDAEELILYVREDCIRIEGLPRDKAELIKLPKLVRARVCKAQVSNNVLTIRLVKRPKSTKFHSHTITF